ncbi:MAG: AgmX/PglI C-terminal domain-containing protein [Bdellovibrionales bacterium]|nr:AgmX/PglI C-terminal domain-containing protein [Bdellovibrionales bacterium]
MKSSLIFFGLFVSISALAISNEEIHQAIVPHQYEVQVCYKNAVVRVPGLAGKLQVNFELDDKGKASKFTADSSSEIKDKTFVDCVLGKMPFWQFPKAPEGSKVSASYQFAFSAK